VILFAIVACTEVLALVLRFTARKQFAAWVLAIGTLPVIAQIAIELSQPTARIGGATVQSDLKSLGSELTVLALALLSLWRRAGWFCFWLGWTLNLILVGVFVYLSFFWRVFS
jgi:hypothetical protein